LTQREKKIIERENSSVQGDEQMANRYQAPIVIKAFQILRIISRSEQGLTLSEVSKRLKISKSTVHGILSALEEVGAIVRNGESRQYKLGLTVFELGRSAYSKVELKDIARPFMEELMLKTRESVFVGVLNRDHVAIVDFVESEKDLKITSPIGTTLPLTACAPGRVILASMEEEQLEAYVRSSGIRRYTERTITDEGPYLEMIQRVREAGYAIDDEEYLSGVWAVASPIRGNGRVNAAIWVVGFKSGEVGDRIKALGEHTKEAAQKIGRYIRSRVSAFGGEGGKENAS
jgi:IclR family transcriptional regulator, KDG regulon repressor